MSESLKVAEILQENGLFYDKDLAEKGGDVMRKVIKACPRVAIESVSLALQETDKQNAKKIFNCYKKMLDFGAITFAVVVMYGMDGKLLFHVMVLRCEEPMGAQNLSVGLISSVTPSRRAVDEYTCSTIESLIKVIRRI